MEILRARDMGFCFGVRRAVEMMEQSAQEVGPVISLGSIVHNPQVVEQLRQRGVDVARSLDELADASLPVAITAHGVGPDVVAELERRGLDVIDTTCPIVVRSQMWAKRLADEGYAVIIFGDPNHKEVRGVLGWTKGRGYAVPREEDLESLPEDLPHKLGVLSQTTHHASHFARFVQRLIETRLDRISELRVVNTLCNATTNQQVAARELAQQVELMIVVGGRESANTRHLAEVCQEEGVETYHVESAAELRPEWFTGKERVGVTGGASTPDFAIDQVVERIRELAAS